MAIKEIISGTPFPGSYPFNPNFGITAVAIDASGEKFAMRLFAPKSGAIDAFEFRTGTVVNTSSGVKVSFQGLDSSADPDGTISAYRVVTGLTSSTWTVPGKMTDDGTDTGVPLTVTRGQSFYCVIEFQSFVAGDSVSVETLSAIYAIKNTYPNHYTSSWAKIADRGFYMALRYADSSYSVPVGFHLPRGSGSSGSGVTASSSPDERGLAFSYPAPVLLGGALLLVDVEGPCEFRFYDPSVGSDPLETYAQNSAERCSTSPRYFYFPFTADRFIDANRECIISVLGTGATSTTLHHFEAPSNSYLQVMEMGVAWRYVFRTDLGAWSENSVRRPFIFPVVTGLDHEIGGQPQPGFEGTP